VTGACTTAHAAGLLHAVSSASASGGVYVSLEPLDAQCMAVMEEGDDHIRLYDVRTFDKVGTTATSWHEQQDGHSVCSS